MTELQRRAGDKFRSWDPLPKDMSLEDIRALVHDLQVHQVELEMQNEELRRIHAELEDSRAKYSDLYDFAPVGYLTLNSRGIILEANLTASRQLDLERKFLISRPFSAFIDKKDSDSFYRHITDLFKHNKVKTLDIRLINKTGDRFFARLDSIIVETLHGENMCRISVIDITEQKKLQEQFRQSQKMEAVGQLTGGIAHDFNNILSAITGNAYMLNMKTGDIDPRRFYVEQILASAQKAADLIQSMLSFSRKNMMNVRTVALNEIVAGTEVLLARTIGEDIKMKTVLTGDNTSVEADAGLIEQVLINLATNSRYAMPDGGEITIETGRVEFTEEFIASHSFGKPGQYVMLAFSDTGIGMDEKTRERIFEPFFTTKGVGEGSGLGLSMVYGTIKQHKGFIDVSSEPHAGTNIMIYLPLAESEIPESPVREKESGTIAAHGTETLLIAEDDASVRKSLVSILRDYGYTVIESSNGWETVEKFIENRDKVQLLVLDVIMPGKSGKDAYEEIRMISPGIKTIFLSGYTQNIISRKKIVQEGLTVIQKPVWPEVLLKKIRDVLDR